MDQILHMVQQAGKASRELALLPSAKKEAILLEMADALEAKQQSILAANREDLAAAEQEGKGKAFLDRLALSPERIKQMAEGMRQVDGAQRHPHREKACALWRCGHNL